MMRLKVKYKDDTELLTLLQRLGDHVTKSKTDVEQKGKYKRAYIDVDFSAAMGGNSPETINKRGILL